jgi:IclR family mhp operon transcriptional activator
VAILDGDGVLIRFSTIYDSSISPFHATLNMRLSLFSNALGLAYYAFCPESERQMLRTMIGGREDALLDEREKGWLEWRVQRAREQGRLQLRGQMPILPTQMPRATPRTGR